jgi:acyl-CoA thioester hydrolase
MNEFVMPLKVYCYDTDMGGVVYHANFLKFMDKARTEWIQSIGYDAFDWHGQSLHFVARRAELDYLHPLTVNNEVEIVSYVKDMRRISMRVEQYVRDAKDHDKVYFKGLIKIAAVNGEGRLCEIPSELQKGLMGERG